MDGALLDKVAIVSAIGAFVGVGFFYVRRIAVGSSAKWWAWAWIAFFVSLAASVVPGVLADLVAHGLGTAFPVLLLAGALAFTGLTVPRALVPIGLAVGLVRGLGSVTDLEPVRLAGVYLFEAPVDFLAGWLVLLHARRSEGAPIIGTLGLLLIGFGVLEITNTVYLTSSSATPSTSYFSLGMAGTLALALTQILALGEQVRAEHVKDLELLRTIAHAGTVESEPVEVSRCALDALYERMNVDAGGIWLLCDDERHFECVHAIMHIELVMPEDMLRPSADRPLPQMVLTTGEPIYIDDLLAVPDLPVHPLYAESGLRSGCILPLRRGDDALGFLLLGRSWLEPFDESDRRILQTAASEISLALQHVEAVARLAVERRKLGSVLAASPTGILVADPGGRTELMNGTFAFHMGLAEADEWIGRPVARLPASVAARVDEPGDLNRCFDTDVDEAPTTVSAHIGGAEPRELLVFSAPIPDENDGGVAGRVWVTRDVSEERRLQAQLRQSQKMETLGTLAGGVAHDFNNQLTAILGNARLVLESGDCDDEAREALGDAVQAAEHCADLTKSLLAFARRAPLRTEVVSTTRVVDQAVGLLRSLLPATIDFRVESDPALPALMADPTQLQQILINLVVNARDAVGGEGEISLGVRAREFLRPVVDDAAPGLFVEFVVHDDGPGMDEETRQRIFDPFFTTKGVHEGTGLGLAVVYGAARAHGGWVDVDSEPGQGSTFRVAIPATTESVEPAEPTPSTRGSAGRGRLLVADDEEKLRQLVARVLSRAGYEVIEAADGREAVETFEAAPTEVDLVLLDVTMPFVDGFEALKRIREIRPGTPAILVSGLLGFDDPELFEPHTESLGKPYDLGQLQALVQRVLDEAR